MISFLRTNRVRDNCFEKVLVMFYGASGLNSNLICLLILWSCDPIFIYHKANIYA